MKSHSVRQSFLDFFEAEGHRVTPSASLVPHGDHTLLFTNAGMVPFKNYFLGVEAPPSKRAVSVQKCMRVSGKHNDLENVGPSHRHHTFFEMLGNFSFGDYFKEEAIRFGWELVTGVWGLDGDRLFATVFEEDDEAAELWQELSGLPAERILRCGAKDNFWAMGDTGPCGPCSEIFVDLTPDEPHVDWDEGGNSGRYLEIWNLVFMQFDRAVDGSKLPLPNPSIDTGAGLERVAAVLQGVHSNYDSDLFQPLVTAAANVASVRYGHDSTRDVSLRVIADHLRAVGFLLADGVIPGNEGRGYVLRRILRRAVRHGMTLGLEEPFLAELLPVLTDTMGSHYPDLDRTLAASKTSLQAEEEKFLGTLAAGSRRVQEAVDEAHRNGRPNLDGATVFRLYDTYGLPIELLREIAEEEQLGVDEEGFEKELAGQRKRSRAAIGDARKRLAAIRAVAAPRLESNTHFVGYDELESNESRVLALIETPAAGDAPPALVDVARDRTVVVLEPTPFYAEAGGQVGDRGRLTWDRGEARVKDVQKLDHVYFHFVDVTRGELRVDSTVSARVSRDHRKPTERNHTATHLLHAALQHVLGDGVRQAGSLVVPDRLRFDFTFGRPLSEDELTRVEDLVNGWVLQASCTVITTDRDFEEAREAGAMALFGEKYGDRVRTVGVAPLVLSDAERLESLELCGGCHVANTGEIGLFTITSERAVASGVRRIEARTGEGARALARQQTGWLNQVAELLSVPADAVADEVAALAARQKAVERELSQARMRMVSDSADELEPTSVDGVKILVREVPAAPANELRSMADVLRSKLGSGVVILAARGEAKVSLLAAVSNDLTDRLHAGKLVGEMAQRVDGRGGGRADFAQAGGKGVEKLPEALAAVPDLIGEQLKQEKSP